MHCTVLTGLREWVQSCGRLVLVMSVGVLAGFGFGRLSLSVEFERRGVVPIGTKHEYELNGGVLRENGFAKHLA